MGKRKYTYEIVEEYMSTFGYKLLSDKYNSCTDKLSIQCPKGHQYDGTFINFKQGKRCPYCSGNKLNYGVVKDHVESQGYKLLSSEFKGRKYKLLMRCPDGHEYETTWDNFRNGHRCPTCASNKIKYTYEEVKEYIENFDYKLLSKEYINTQTHLLVMCPSEHSYEVTFNNFRIGKRCPVCAGNVKLTYDYISTYIERYNYKLLSTEYINNRTPLKMQCDKGHAFKCSFDNFQKGNRCPKCKNTKGQIKIKDVLMNYKIDFIEEYRFDDCKFKRTLPFDFYLPDYNCCIEFDGLQHYVIKEYFGGYEGFVDRKIRDTIKNIYCEKNNIKLVRIHYEDMKNLEDIILNKIINE